MARPNLEDPDARAAYKRELRRILPLHRYAAVLLMVAGVMVWFWPRFFGGPWFIGNFQTMHVGWALIALGWILAGYVIYARTRYHKRRMAEKP